MKATLGKEPNHRPWPLIVVFLILGSAIILFGSIYYARQKRSVIANQTQQLQAVADLKIAEIGKWIDERMADARVISSNPILSSELISFLREPAAGPRRESIRGWMLSLQANYHYQNVLLLDQRGGIALSASSHNAEIGNEGQKLLELVRTRQDALLSNLHESPEMHHIHLDMATPLLAGGDVAGYVLLRIDPGRFLYSLLQSWPTPSPSAETLLVRREGADVLFLNELRHRADTAMNLRIPLSRSDVPAVQAVLGRTGVVRGVDYRGVPVWSIIRPVSGTAWFVVAKADEREILAPLRRSALALLLIALSLILATALLILLIWQRQHTRFRLRQLEAHREKQALVKHFDYLSRYANDLILLSDSEHNIIEANERAVQAYGYSREQLLAMNIRMLRAPNERESIDDDYRQAKDRDGIIFEALHQRRDGSTFPVEVSARIIQFEGQEYFQSIYRDISERKRTEEKLLSSHAFLANVIDMSPFAMWIADTEGTVIRVNRSLCDAIRLAAEDIVGKYNVFHDANLEEQGVMPQVKAVFEKQTPARFTIPWQAAEAGDESFQRARDMYIDVSMFPIAGAGGKLVNVICQWIDISELKRAEAELRESEERYRRTLDNMMEGCQIIGFDWRYRFVNDAVTRHGHQAKENLLGRTMMEIYPGIENTEMFRTLERCMKERLPQQMENEFIYLDGSKEWFELSMQPVPEGVFILSIDITKRKKAEVALQESEVLLNDTERLARIGGWEWDVERRSMRWTDEIYRIHGMTPGDPASGSPEHIDRSLACYDLADRPVMEAAFRSCTADGQSYDLEFPLTRIDGRRIRIRTMAHAVKKGDQIVKVIGNIMDITERKQAEENLQRLSERNQALLDAVPDIIMEVDAKKAYTWANHAGIEFFGADVIGREAAHYFEGEQETYQTVKPVFNGREEVLYVESWQRRRDNEKRLLAWWCRVLKDSAGNVAGALSSARDITDMKRAEEALRASERKFRETVATLDEGYYSVTLDGTLLDHNRSFNLILGFDPDQDRRGTSLPDFWLNPEARAAYVKTLSATGAISNYQIEAKTQKGVRITILASAHLVKDENGKPLRIEGIFLDISERIRQEKEIHLLNEELELRVEQRTTQLEAANKELEAFSYSVSHDLRAPLRAIDGFSRIILEDYVPKLDDEGRRLLDVIRSNTGKMGHLIDDLLAFSRLSRQQMAAAPVNLALMAKVIFAELKNQEKGRHIEFKIGPMPVARGDYAMLQQVLQNLLANAVKFTRNRSRARIDFSGEAGPGENVYRIKDNGVGFDMQYVGKLFGVFQRLHGTDEFEGTGVGLAIVQRIILRHGGRVGAESKDNKGATFYFTLPEEQGTGDRG